MARKYQLHGAFPSKAGDSAYQIAQKNDFDGTEQEWLESLIGKDGKDGLDAPQEAVLYTPQALTDEQKAQARENIGAGGAFSDSPMELIAEGVTTEQVNSVTITLDNDGQPFEIQDFYLIWKAKTISVAGTGTVVGRMVLHSNETQFVFGDAMVGWRAADTLSEKPFQCYFNIGHFVCSRSDSGSNFANSAVASKLNNIIQYPITGISISMTTTPELFEVGATYQLYGRRVKK